ncbi:MAG: DUF2610 domain-containing protein [Roseomonas sp.]|nr:DUF2610 domain-containing protein [Roseomonas sp.]
MMRQPYPGLRAFSREETDLFFGRENCIDTMVERLAATRFLAVLGSSGSGKSSLVRTGLLDALELGWLSSAGSRWAVATMRPAGAPIANLASSLQKIDVRGAGDANELELLDAFLRRGPRSVLSWCSEGHLAPRTNLLIVVDQFEELFRFGDYAGREEAEAFVSLLLESVSGRDLPIYVVLTMRSEFLGACSLVPGLAERINQGLYLTPRMTREETREAIIGPAAVCGFDIEPALVNRLLNDLAAFAPWEDDQASDQLRMLSRRADQLPLMQHVLNRLWLRARESAGSSRITLRMAEYELLGGLGGAIDAHAAEVVAALPTEAARLVARVFRGLVTGSTVATALRHPCRFADLVDLCEGARDPVVSVVEAFRAAGCNFLMPPPETALSDETIIDISHESLIRQWSDLSGWLEREAQAGSTWRRLVASAEAHASGRAELLSGLDLHNMASWLAEEQPNQAWAERHGGGFASALDFVDRSKAAEEAREQLRRAQAAERQARDRREKLRLRWTSGLMVVLTLGLGVAGWQARLSEQQALRSEQELIVRNTEIQAAQNDLETALREAKQERREAIAARSYAEQSFSTASGALGGVLRVVQDPRYSLRIGSEEVVVELLTSLVPHLEALAAINPLWQTAGMQAEALTRMARQLAVAQSSEATLPVARRAHGQFLALSQERTLTDRELMLYAMTGALLVQQLDRLALREDQATILDQIGRLLPLDAASIAAASPDRLDAYGWFINSLDGTLPFESSNQFKRELRELNLDVSRRLLAERPDDPQAMIFLALALNWLSDSYRRLDRAAEATSLATEAYAYFEQAYRAAPWNVVIAANWVGTLRAQAETLRRGGKPAEALAAIERAHATIQPLLTVAPRAMRLISAGTLALDTYALILRDRGDLEAAARRGADAFELASRALHADPRNTWVAEDIKRRLATFQFTGGEGGLQDYIRESCLRSTSEVLDTASRYPAQASLQNLAAAVLNCAVDNIRAAPIASTAAGAETQDATSPGAEQSAVLDRLLRQHGAYIEASFLDSGRRVADDLEFHVRMSGVVQRLQRLAERDDNRAEAERLAGVLVAGLTPRRVELDYDIFAMGRLSRAHRDLADHALARGDIPKAVEHLRICSDPTQLPYPDRECMIRLADMAERGDLGPGQEALAQELRARAPHYALKSFNIPIRLAPDSPPFTLRVYIPPPPAYQGIDHMVRWAKEVRGLEIPNDVVTSFRKLHEIAKQNNVSFPELAVYALGQAEREQREQAASTAPAPPPRDAAIRRIIVATPTGFTPSPHVSSDQAGIALGGYDVVAYFQFGQRQRGSAEHFVIQGGAIWLFASAENADSFRADPARFMPQFGGFCAGCIAQGSKTHGSVNYWDIIDGRLYVHSSAGLRDSFLAQYSALRPRAEAEWERRRDTAITPAQETDTGSRLRAARR